MSLPSGYAQLAYIKSSGAQYIDTGVTAAKDLKVEAIMDVDESSSWIMILGDYTSSKYFSWWAKGNLAYAYFGSKSGTLTFSAGKHTYIADGPNNKWGIDGTSITIEPASSDFSGAGGTLYLFSVHNGGSYTSASAKLYSCKIYKNGTLIRDFVPCRNASGTLGLYDLTNNRFYGNAGSGDFEAGPEKTEDQAHKTLIDGTWYDLKAGKCLVGGTAYSVKNGRVLVNSTGYDIPFSSGIQIGTLQVGSVVKIGVNGKSYDFLVVNHGIPSNSSLYDSSCDGTWLLMKDIYTKMLYNRSYTNYADGPIPAYLDGDFFNLIDNAVNACIKTVSITCKQGFGTVSKLSCKIFILGAAELGSVGNDAAVDGAKLSYFEAGNGTLAMEKRIASYNGIKTHYWSRSPISGSGGQVAGVDTYGNIVTLDIGKNIQKGVRPAFTLPSTFPVIQNPDGTYSPAA